MRPDILYINLPAIPFDSLINEFEGKNTIPPRLEMPMGLLYISSYLKKHNNIGRVKLLDYNYFLDELRNFKDIDDFIRGIAATRVDIIPNVLAFSLIFSTSHHFFVRALNILKSKWPAAVSIVGGHHATNATNMLLQNCNLDYVLRGEAEMAFSDFIKQLSESKAVKVKGVYSQKDISSSRVPLELGEYVMNLDDLPFPDWEILGMDKYKLSRGRKRNIGESSASKSATIMTTRGCPFQCTFCSSHTVHGRRVRMRSVENVLQEVKLLHNLYGITLFIPEDDMFLVNKERSLKMLTELQNAGIPDFEMQFPNGLSISTLNEEVIDKLVATGMKVASLAIESGSEYVQRRVIKKNCDLKKAKKMINYLRDRGVIVRCFYVIGFPGETKEHMLETIDYAKASGADWSALSIATPLMGSEMYAQFVEMGCIRDDPEMWSRASYNERKFDTPQISARELNEFVYRANLEINFVNNVNLVRHDYSRAIDIFSDIISNYSFHIIGWYCLKRSYEGLGRPERAEEIDQRISSLIDSDERAKEMFVKYQELLPELAEIYGKQN